MGKQAATHGPKSARTHRAWTTPVLAGGLAVALTAGVVIASGGGAAGADSSLAASTGRFLSGTAGGTSFDTVASLNGESANYPNDPGPNQDNLSGSLLGQSITSPTAVAIPGGGGITFGAVAQYAAAKSDGSATGASGAVDNQGIISVGGKDGVPTGGATVDLSQFQGASALTNVLGNLSLTVGAVSGSATQPAAGKAQKDPAASCTNNTYERVSSEHQAGAYDFSKLQLDATSPALTQVGTAVTGALTNVISALSTALNAIPGGVITVTGLPDGSTLASDLTVNIFDGGLTASLTDGAVHVDFAKILKFLHLDLDNLCPNTSLLPYLTQAVAQLPTAIGDLLTNLKTSFATALTNVVVKVGGVAVPTGNLTGALDAGSAQLASAFSSIGTALASPLQTLASALSQNVLDVVVNGQQQSGNTFTETAVQLDLLPGGVPSGGLPSASSVPTPTSSVLPTPSGLPVGPLAKKANSAAQSSATPSGAAQTGSAKSAKFAGFAAPAAAAPAAATDPAVQLNLGQASVSAQSIAIAATNTDTTAPANTSLPTGVPAGQALHGGTSTPSALLAVLATLALLLAGGGTLAYRRRVGTHR